MPCLRSPRESLSFGAARFSSFTVLQKQAKRGLLVKSSAFLKYVCLFHYLIPKDHLRRDAATIFFLRAHAKVHVCRFCDVGWCESFISDKVQAQLRMATVHLMCQGCKGPYVGRHMVLRTLDAQGMPVRMVADRDACKWDTDCFCTY